MVSKSHSDSKPEVKYGRLVRGEISVPSPLSTHVMAHRLFRSSSAFKAVYSSYLPMQFESHPVSPPARCASTTTITAAMRPESKSVMANDTTLKITIRALVWLAVADMAWVAHTTLRGTILARPLAATPTAPSPIRTATLSTVADIREASWLGDTQEV